MANLTLVPEPVDVEAIESEVLARAIEDMAEWIDALPCSSEWRWSFTKARLDLEGRLAKFQE